MTGPDLKETGIGTDSDQARYYCYVQNPFGGASSTVCVLTVVGAPVLTKDISATSLEVDKGAEIALSATAEGGNLETDQWLAEQGVNVNAKDSEERTP